MRIRGIGRSTSIGAILALMVVALSILLPRFASAQDCARNMLSITGPGSYVSTPDVQSLHLTNGFTIECWAKQNGASRFPALIDKSSGAASYFGIFFDTASKVFGSLRHSATQVRLYSPLIDSQNVWHHYAFVFRPADSLYLYIDSVEVASASAKGLAGIDSSKDALRIGASGIGTSFIGSIDEVRIWSVPQSLATVTSSLYRTLGAGDSTLVLYYSFDDEAGSLRVHDFSGHGHDGYLQGVYCDIVPSSSPVVSGSHGFSLGAKEVSIIIPSKRCNPTFDTVIHIRNVGVHPIVVNSYGFFVGKSFSIVTTFPLTLPADSNRTDSIQLHFSPTAGGVYEDSIFISSADECGGTLRMLIHATYDSVGLRANPSVLNFGPHTQCQLPQQLTTTVYNTSSTDSVTILSQTIPPGSGLSIVTHLPLVVHKNDSAQLVVQLVKGVRGPVSAKISVSLDKCSREASVDILGDRELAEVSLPPTFYLGTSHSSLTGVRMDTFIVVTNSGDVQENIQNVSTSPPGILTVLDSRKGMNLSPGDTARIHISMFDTTCGHIVGTLHVQGGLSCMMDTTCLVSMDLTPPLPLVAAPLDVGRVCSYLDTTITVTNPNNYPVRLEGISFAGKDIFFADPNYIYWHSVIGAHGSLPSVPIRFYPGKPGDFTDTAFIQMSPCGIGMVVCTGTLGFKDLTATPSALDFGRGCDTSIVRQTVTIVNNSQRSVTLVDSAHTGSKRFVVSPTGLPITLQSGQSRTISITYTPTLGSKDTGTFAFVSADGCPAVSINLQGVREKASGNWNVTTGEFDTVCAGSSKVISIPFTNSGLDSIDVVGASITGSGFTLDSVPKHIGSNGTIQVRFSPTTRSDYAGSLLFIGDNCGTMFSLPLHGSGGPAPSIVLLDTAHDFGSIRVGDSVEYCVSITNPSCTAIPMTLSGIASPFHIASSSGLSTLVRGDTARMCIVFKPTGHDTSNVILTYHSDSAASQTITLHGVGLAPDIRLATHVLDFGFVLRNTPSILSVLASNVGNGTAALSASNLNLQYTSVIGTPIAANASGNLRVTFKPLALGLIVDTVRINWNGHTDSVIVRGYGADSGLQLSSVGVDFGDVHVGHDSTRELYLTATTNFPRVDSFHIAFASLDSFSYQCASVLPYQITSAQDTIAVNVTFHAHIEQRDTGTLSIYSSGSILRVPLTARGVEAHPKLNVTVLGFADVQVGGSSISSQPVSIRDTGGYELFVNSIVSDTEFSIEPDLPTTAIPAGGTRQFNITFHPTRARRFTRILQFATSSPDTLPAVLLFGTGVYPTGTGPSIAYTVASETVNAGDHVSIPISMTGIRLDKIDADSLILYVRFDPQMVKMDNITAANGYPSARLSHLTDSTIMCVLMGSSFSVGQLLSLQAEALLGSHTVSYIYVDSVDPTYEVAQSNSDGVFTVADCFGPVHGVTFAGSYSVNAIRPNPTSDNALLDFTLGIEGAVSIDVYNAVGQLVRRIDAGQQKQGAHTTTLDVAGLPDGRYVYQLKSSEYHSEGSLVILH